VLLSVVSALEAEMVFLRNLVGSILSDLEDDIDRDKFRRLLHCSRKLSNFHNRAELVQEALTEVLEQDEDLNAMYLTDKKQGVARQVSDHEELEVLLESFSKQVEEIVTESESAKVHYFQASPVHVCC
jgi:magnesium transporter